jgi:hypothetical protein
MLIRHLSKESSQKFGGAFCGATKSDMIFIPGKAKLIEFNSLRNLLA